MKIQALLALSFAINLTTSTAFAAMSEHPAPLGAVSTTPPVTAKKTEYWTYNGDPELASKFPGEGFGLVKGTLEYPKEICPADPTSLANRWFKLEPTSFATRPYTAAWFASDAYKPEQKHAVAIFSTLTNAVIQEWNDWQVLKSLNSTKDIAQTIATFQSHDNDQSIVYPDKGVEQNAFYMAPWEKTPSSLSFFHFTGNDGKLVLTGASSDVSIHEVGHKRHHDMRPGHFNLMDDSTPRGLELGAFSEGFGDVYSLLWSVRNTQQRARAFKQVGLSFHNRDNIISDLGEQFGSALGLKTGIRNLDDNVILGQAEREVHAMGLVWAGGWYDVFASSHEYATAAYIKSGLSIDEAKDKGAIMCANYLARLNMLSTLLVEDPQPTFSHFLAKITQIIQERKIVITGDSAVDNAPWDLAFIMHMAAVRKIPTNAQGHASLGIIPNKPGKPGCSGVVHSH